MSGQLPWFVARAAGLVAWALLSATVLWGLALSTRVLRRWARPAWVLDLHRFVAALTVVFVGVHVAALLLDTYVHFGLVEILVPLASTWHPVGVAWGVAGLYLLLAVEITSLLRSRLPRTVWKRVHLASLVLFAAATVHGFSTGTDRTNMAVILVGVTGAVGAAALAACRFGRTAGATGPPVRPGRKAPSPAPSGSRDDAPLTGVR